MENINITDSTVYKLGFHKESYVLIYLELLNDSITNINRSSVINKKYAKHRCDKALVKKIINVKSNKEYETAISLYDNNFKYHLGKIIVTDFDSNLENVCSTGIHFFLDKERALLYNNPYTYNNDEYKTWHDNGAFMTIGKYVKGMKNGKFKNWDCNNNLIYEANFINDKIDGEFKEWYSNNKLLVIANYDNGILLDLKTFDKNGKVIFDSKFDKKENILIDWHSNGIIKCLGKRKNKYKIGLYQEWYENGQLKLEINYSDDKYYDEEYLKMNGEIIDGEVKEWYEDGSKRSYCKFKHGEKDGVCLEWDENGNVTVQYEYKDGEMFNLEQKYYENEIDTIMFIPS